MFAVSIHLLIASRLLDYSISRLLDKGELNDWSSYQLDDSYTIRLLD